MKPCKYGHTTGRYENGGCRECSRIRNRAWKEANLERKRAYGRAYFRSLSDAKKREYLGLPDPTRPRPRLCELCGQEDRHGKLALDHDHVTGKFRGWLCRRCNAALGALGDSIASIKQALAYLRRAV